VSSAVGAVSHETIYQVVYGPEGRRERLFEMLAMAQRRWWQCFGWKPRRDPFPTERRLVVLGDDAFGRDDRAGSKPEADRTCLSTTADPVVYQSA
jgi:hypothetical protein